MDLLRARNHGRKEEEEEGEGEMETEGEGEVEGEKEREGEGEGEIGGVPLGEVLLGTTMELRVVSPAAGERVCQGFGEIWLGENLGEEDQTMISICC